MELAEAKATYAENRFEEINLEAAIHYGAELIVRADKLWKNADLRQRQRIQRVIFPQGLEWSRDEGYRTPVSLTI